MFDRVDTAASPNSPKASASTTASTVTRRATATSGCAIDASRGRAVVAEPLQRVFADVRPQFARAIELMRQVKGVVNELAADEQGQALLRKNELDALHRDYVSRLAFATPYTTCVYCKCKGDPGCKCCKGTGWMSKSQFNQAPGEMKE